MKAIAKVQVVLDVHLNQPWEETETMQYIREAAQREATELVECAVQTKPNIHVSRIQQITISIVEDK